MDGIRLITLSECVANIAKHPEQAPEILADWVDNSRHAGSRTRSEIRKIGDGVIRRLCNPDEPLTDCPALVFAEPDHWCDGCRIGRLRRTMNTYPWKERR